MSDFADGIRKAVRAARESAKQQQDRQRRREEEESGRQEQNRRRARELRGLMWDRIRDAEEAGDGAIKAHRKSGVALTTFQLLWCRACGGEHAWGYFVYDRTAREGPVPLVGETVGEFAVYTTADTFHVLP